MRSYIALPIVLAVASVAPALAAPVTTQPTGSEAINWDKVGDIAGDVASGVGTVLKFLKREDPILARAFEDELLARAAPAASGSEALNWGKVASTVLSFLKREDELFARGEEPAAGSKAINWGSLASTVLSFLKREDPILAREFEDNLMARADTAEPTGSEAINWKKVGDVAGDVASGVGTVLKFLKREDPLLARAFEDELLARAEPTGSEAINWKKVGDVAGDVASGVGTVLKFLKREDPLLARAFEEELMARATPPATGSEALNWGKVASTVLSFLKREDELMAREATPPAGSQAINWGKVASTVLSFLKREDDMLMARGEPPATGSQAINWGKIAGTVLSFLKREDELVARGEPPAEGSQAINWGKVAGTVLHFLKREDPMLARAFEDDLVARASPGGRIHYFQSAPVDVGHSFKYVQRSWVLDELD